MKASSYLVSISLIALLPCGNAWAEEVSGGELPHNDAGTSADSRIQDIVVTARKRSESQQTVPLAITGISSATIEEKNITSMERLNGMAPSLYMEASPGPTSGGITMYIRGIGGSDSTGVPDYPIAIYVDGILVSSRPNALLFDLVDLERVEVLRGPQGTLFGRNTTGGAINIFTKRPSEDFGVEEKLTYGTHNLFKSRTTLDTGVLGESGISAKLAYSHEQVDGYIKNTLSDGTEDPGARNSESGYVAIHGEVSPQLTFDLRGDISTAQNTPIAETLGYMRPLQLAYYSNSSNLGGAPLRIGTSYPDNVTIADQPRGRMKVWGGALTLDYNISPALNLKSITGYRKFQESVPVNNGGQGELMGVLKDGSIGRIYMFDYFEPDPSVMHQHQFTEEIQATGDFGDLGYVLGFYYFDELQSRSLLQNFTLVDEVAPGDIRGSNARNERYYKLRTKSYAVYGQLSYKPTSQLELAAGLRYTKDKKTMFQDNVYNGYVLGPGEGSKSWSNVSWLGSVNYRFSPEVMAYARVSTAYRAGGFDVGGGGVPNDYGPEKVTSYEVGLKSDLFDRRLRFNLSAYLADYKDLQVSQFVVNSGGGRSITVNAGAAQFTGFEAELTAVLSDTLSIDGSVGYVHPNYKTYIYRDPSSNELINVADEVHLAHVPKTTAAVGMSWDIAQWDKAALSLRLDYTYQSSALVNPLDRVSPYTPQIPQSAQNNLNARLTLKDWEVGPDTRVSLQVYGENLLNERRVTNAVDWGGLGFATLVWGPRRKFGVTLTASY